MRERMHIKLGIVLTVALMALAATQVRITQNQGKNVNGAGREGNVEHGKYLVERVAMCIQCHSPRDEQGAIIGPQLLMGAPIPFTSPFRNQQWANTAPRIAGLPQYTVEEGVKLLTTGISRTGKPLMPPMPPFRMTEQDARDVIAFLKSLR